MEQLSSEQCDEIERRAAHVHPKPKVPTEAGWMAVAYSLGALLLFGGLEDAGVRDELAGVIGLTTAWTLAYFGSSREWNRYYKVHAEVLDAVSKRDAKKNA